MKIVKIIPEKVDNTKNRKKLNSDEFFVLRVKYHNNEQYIYYGKSKKECKELYSLRWGNSFLGFKEIQWDIEIL